MKKLLLFLINISFFIGNIKSQIVLDSADFAPIGQNFIMAIDVFSTKDKIKLENFGTDSWDFSSLKIDDYDTIRHLSPTKTRYGDFFDSSNYVRYFGFTEMEYYHLSSERLVKVGLIGDYLNLDAPALVPFQQHIVRYEFPIKIGLSFADTVYQKFKTPYSLVDGIDSVRADIFLIESTTFDKYGTVTTPQGTYQTIREKNVQKKKIKAYQYGIYGWTPAPRFDKEFVQTTYSWYAKDQEIPVAIAEVNNAGYLVKIKYKYYAPMSLNFDTKHVSCRGGKNGSINLTVIGGIPDYTYLWSNSNTNEDLKGLVTGTYTVLVTDNKGSTINGGFSVSEPQDSLFMNPLIKNISCYGKRDGELALDPSGGIPPYFVIWSNDSVANSIKNLSEGIYGVILRDANRCIKTDTLQIIAPKDPLNVTIEDTKTTCFDGEDGQLKATPKGGTPPYFYKWSNGDTNAIALNLKAAEYKLLLTDKHGCLKEKIATVVQPTTALEIVFAASNVTCKDAADGEVFTTVTGGCTPYNFLWSNGVPNKNIKDLQAGNYTLTVTDNCGCVATKTLTISQPQDSIIINYTKTDVDCFNEKTGEIKLKVTGGTPDYSYKWNTGETTADINNLLANSYTIEVKDIKNCTAKKTIKILQPEGPILIEASTQNVTCFGKKDGAIDIYVYGGTAPYKFKWSTGKTDEDLTNLAPGKYTIKVTDAKNCTKEKTFDVSNPTSELIVDIEVTPPTASDKNDGKITLKVSGGETPYRYKWNNEAETNYLDHLAPGDYSVNIIDNFGCILLKNITIKQP